MPRWSTSTMSRVRCTDRNAAWISAGHLRRTLSRAAGQEHQRVRQHVGADRRQHHDVEADGLARARVAILEDLVAAAVGVGGAFFGDARMEPIREIRRGGTAAPGRQARRQEACRPRPTHPPAPLHRSTHLPCANVGRIRDVRLHIALIVLAGALVYGTGLSGPLLFDDETSILNNASIRQLTPLSGPLEPAPQHAGGRPARGEPDVRRELRDRRTGRHRLSRDEPGDSPPGRAGALRDRAARAAAEARAQGAARRRGPGGAGRGDAVGGPPAEQRVGQLSDRAQRVADGALLPRDALHGDSRRHLSAAGDVDRRGRGGVGSGHGVEGIDGHGAGDGAAVRPRVPVWLVARGVGRAAVSLWRPGGVVDRAGRDPVVRAAARPWALPPTRRPGSTSSTSCR